MICSDILTLCNYTQGGALETSDSYATGDFRLPKVLGKPVKRKKPQNLHKISEEDEEIVEEIKKVLGSL